MSRDKPPILGQPPRSGFLPFFPLSRAWRSQPSSSCSDLIAMSRCHPSWLHHTRLEALAPPGERWQSTVGGRLCGLAMMLSPRTGLCTGMAEPGWLASSGQARERGSPRPFVRLSPLVQEPEWMSNQSLGLGDIRPMCTFAFRDAGIQDIAHARSRLIPSMSS